MSLLTIIVTFFTKDKASSNGKLGRKEAQSRQRLRRANEFSRVLDMNMCTTNQENDQSQFRCEERDFRDHSKLDIPSFVNQEASLKWVGRGVNENPCISEGHPVSLDQLNKKRGRIILKASG